jgi:hypothetical protein
MSNRFYRVTRDLHLYFGLFISPFVLVFAVSVFFLVHSRSQKRAGNRSGGLTVSDLPLPADLEAASGRQRMDKLKPVLERLGVQGEVGWVRHFPKQHRLVIPVTPETLTPPGAVCKVRSSQHWDLGRNPVGAEERRPSWVENGNTTRRDEHFSSGRTSV